MELEVRDFRHAQAILANGREWQELGSVAKAITARDVTETHAKLNAAKRAAGKKLIAGGRSALNALFREALEPMPLAWETEPRLFASDDRDMRGWKMDFLKNRVGVEISFNHAEAIP